MEQMYVVKNQKKLRAGYTTGSCAAAASKAAADMLLGREKLQYVKISTPKGIELKLEVLDIKITENSVICAAQKDAGDDPDITHGLKIYAEVIKTDKDIIIDGGKGVGKVTKPGLSCAVGGAAINPVPRKMITEALLKTAQKYNYLGGLKAVISAPGGEKLAERTFNPQLGIVGGISILGTSGIVEPMSEKALIDTIYVELDSKKAIGQDTILICPGNYGQDFAKEKLNLDINLGVKCSNYIGNALDYAVYKGFSEVLLVGHAGKLIKLASGIFQTHSSTADGRQEIFAAHAALCNADVNTVKKLMQSITVDECIEILKENSLEKQVFNSIKEKIINHLELRVKRNVKESCRVEFILFTNKFGEIMRTDGADMLLEKLRIMENNK